MVGIFVFTSCKNEEPEGPTVTVTPTSVDAWKGDTVTFNYSISSNEKIKSLTATPNTSLLAEQEITTFSGDYSATGTIEFILPTSSLNDGDAIIITFKAVDADGEEYADETTATINIKEPTQPGNPINTWTSVTLGGEYSSYGSYYDVTGNHVYLSSTVGGHESEIDIIYSTATSSNESFWAPDQVTVFNGNNATRFATTSFTASDFDAMTDDTNIASLTPTATKAENITANSVYAFVTATGKKGLIKVTTLTTNEVTFDVKIQQ
ncbi:MAG: hypothetical protein Kow0068_26020 [Marinilabiliales bacterium]